jgi:hypothetical protein
MCRRWLRSFKAFLHDLGPRPQGHSLDRIDNDRDYTPGNVRWARRTEQNSNQRRNRFVVFRGDRLTVAEASRRMKISPFVVYGRLNNGWRVERALTTPVKPAVPGR